MEWDHWLHGLNIAPLGFPNYFSGAPVVYPPLLAAFDSLGGLPAARCLSLLFMMAATSLLWSVTRRLYDAVAAFYAQRAVRLDRHSTGSRGLRHIRRHGGVLSGRSVLARRPQRLRPAPCVRHRAYRRLRGDAGASRRGEVRIRTVEPNGDRGCGAVAWRQRSCLVGSRALCRDQRAGRRACLWQASESAVTRISPALTSRRLKRGGGTLADPGITVLWQGITLIWIVLLPSTGRRDCDLALGRPVTPAHGGSIGSDAGRALNQAHIGTYVSLYKHVTFGAWFGAIAAGWVISLVARRASRDRWRIGAADAFAGAAGRVRAGDDQYQYWPGAERSCHDLRSVLSTTLGPVQHARSCVAVNYFWGPVSKSERLHSA